jgi:hypothetical protein
MEQIKCPTCGHLNAPDAAQCAECGTALAVPYATPVVPESETVVVHRSSANQAAVLSTIALALVALVVVGLLMYQWGRAEQSDDDLASTRAERGDRDARPTTSAPPTVTTVPATTPPPVVTTYPSAPPVTVEVPQATAPTPVPSDAAQNARYVAEIDPLLRDWDRLVTAAKTSTGPALSQTVEQLDAIQRKASRIDAPASAASAHGHLLTAMTATIDALETSAANLTDPMGSAALEQAEELYDDFKTEYQGLRKR